MKREKRLSAIAVTVFLAVLSTAFASCENADGPTVTDIGDGVQEYRSKYVYDGETVFYTEETSFQVYGEGTEVEGNKYLFEYTVPVEERDRCVDVSEAVLSYLDNDKGMTVTVYDDAFGENSYVKQNEAYTYRQDFDTADYAAHIVLAAYGRYCNYGMAYGFAQYILEKLALTDSEGNSLPLLSDGCLYDMNTLCFSEKYTRKEDVSDLKIFASVIVKSYIEKYGEYNFTALIKRSGNSGNVSDAAEALKEFYAACGIEREGSNVLYTFGGKSNEFIARSEFAQFEINDDWTDNAETPMYDGKYVDPEFMHGNYCEVREFFETITEEMRSYQQFFALDEYDNSLNIIFYGGSTEGNTSYYGIVGHTVILKSIMSLMHEYIHSLTAGYCKKELWAYEGLANKYALLYNSYALPFLNYDSNNPDPDNPSYGYLFVYLDYIGRDIDLLTDDNALMDLFVYHFEAYDINSNYKSASSFINYIERVYGKEKSIKYCFEGEYGAEIEGKTHEELIADWKAYVQESCRKYY